MLCNASMGESTHTSFALGNPTLMPVRTATQQLIILAKPITICMSVICNGHFRLWLVALLSPSPGEMFHWPTWVPVVSHWFAPVSRKDHNTFQPQRNSR